MSHAFRAVAEESCEAAALTRTFRKPGRSTSPARIRSAVLLARIYDVLPQLCPARGCQMRILAFLTDPPVVSAILLHVELPHQPRPISPPRSPPQRDFLNQTPAFDPTDAECDQSVPEEFED